MIPRQPQLLDPNMALKSSSKIGIRKGQMSEERRNTRQPPSFSGQAFIEGGNDFQVQIGDRWVKDH